MWLTKIYTKPLTNFQNFLESYLIYIKYKSKANSYWINSNGQNNYLCDSKNIGLNFTSYQYFYGITGTFSWTHLRRFNCWLFLEVSEALKIPQFKFHLNLNMMQQPS